MEVKWTKEAFYTKVYVEIKDKNPINLKKIKILERCQHFDETIMKDGDGNNIGNFFLLDRIDINEINENQDK